jgi:hypothetical protein
MNERDEVIRLIRLAMGTQRVETIDRALAAAKRYLDKHPDDWQVAAACEPLTLIRWSLDSRKIGG